MEIKTTAPIKFHIAAIFNGQASFYECILFCMSGLRELGYEVTYADNQLNPDAINIVFGSYTHLSENATWHAMSTVTRDVIIYNWEQVGSDVPWFNLRYLRQMVNTHVWDYNASNVQALKEKGVQDVHHVPMSYTNEMSVVENRVEQDIDVLFYGVINERRKKVLDAIRAKGLKVVSTEEQPWMMGKERDDFIARSKVVLNMHFFEHTKIFEIARVSYLLANHKAVVSEVTPETDIDDDILQSIESCHIDDIAQRCFEMVQDESRRRHLEEKGFHFFSQRNAAKVLKEAVDRFLLQRANGKLGNDHSKGVALPKTLQIGAGEKWHYMHCNIDKREDFAPDLLVDISRPLPTAQEMQSWRFGRVHFQHNYFDKIIAHYVFQRVDDLQQALTNCLDLLSDGGVLDLTVPLDLSLDAWMHIDDKRAFNDKTWENIINNDWWQYGWNAYRFEITSIGYGLHNDYGMQVLAQNGGDWDQARRMPRAIDTTNAILRKRKLTPYEIGQLPYIRFMG